MCVCVCVCVCVCACVCVCVCVFSVCVQVCVLCMCVYFAKIQLLLDLEEFLLTNNFMRVRTLEVGVNTLLAQLLVVIMQ